MRLRCRNGYKAIEFECSRRRVISDGVVGFCVEKPAVFFDDARLGFDTIMEILELKKLSREERRELADFMKQKWEEFANDEQEEDVWVDGDEQGQRK